MSLALTRRGKYGFAAHMESNTWLIRPRSMALVLMVVPVARALLHKLVLATIRCRVT